MNPVAFVKFFNDLIDELCVALEGLENWGLSGNRDNQYVHDVLADEILLRGLESLDVGILSEESGLQERDGVTVVIDPIDGSGNASRGIPWFSSSLCLVDEHGPLAGVVANLATSERYCAVRGEGAWLTSGLLVHPSSVDSVEDACLVFPSFPPVYAGWKKGRSLGCVSLDLCGVASGRFDAFVPYIRGQKPWDYMAAILICQESGAVVESGDERSLFTLDPEASRLVVAASTHSLLEQVGKIRRSWLQKI